MKRKTNAFEKIFATSLGIFLFSPIILFLLFFNLPFLFIKLFCILLFFLVSLFTGLYRVRTPGLKILNAKWDKYPPIKNLILYSFLYTLSFSTLFFYVLFPFDLLILNLFLFQLPCVILKGTTLHAFLSGRGKTVIIN